MHTILEDPQCPLSQNFNDTMSREDLLKEALDEIDNRGRVWKRVILEDPSIAQLKKISTEIV